MRNVFLVATLALVLFSPVLRAGDYRFSHNGRPAYPKIYPVEGQRMGAPAAGDLAVVFGFAFVLGEPGHYQLRFDPTHASRLLARIDQGPEHCLVIHTARTEIDGKIEFVNPLLEMTAEEKSRLRGLRFDLDPVDWARSLAGIDWSHCALELRNIDFPLPELPDKIRYLRLAPTQPQEDHGFARLQPLTALRYLYVQVVHAPFPISSIPANSPLVNLEIDGTTISDSGALGDLGTLRFLKLRRVEGVDSLDWAAALEGLRVLKVDHTGVSDLQPVLKLPNLRLLSVNATKVASLPSPEAFPALRDFRLHSTPAAEDTEALAPYRPAMSVSVRDWEKAVEKFAWQDYKFGTRDAILFVGSSNIGRWDLAKFFPDLNTRNRGLGGSELSDALIHYDKLVLPNQPRAILLNAGEDDIANGETAVQVVADWKKFAERTRKKLPAAHLAYLPMKPSLERWNLWPEMKKANEAIARLSRDDPHLHYLDTTTPMIGKDEKPRQELFAENGLDLSEPGYAAWTAVVNAWLESLPK